MAMQIRALQCRLSIHWNNYDNLNRNQLYDKYKKSDFHPTNEQLDQLLAQALNSMPVYSPEIAMDTEWRLILTVEGLLDGENDGNPLDAIKKRISENRDALNVSQNWLVSAMTLYEAILVKNLLCIHNDLKQIRQIRERMQLTTETNTVSKKEQSLLFVSQNKLTAEKDRRQNEEEKCCNWLYMDFTAPLFGGFYPY